jgi:hypothetical protein
MLTTGAGIASASTGGGQSSFAARARSAGLTSTQVGTLQQQVNTFIGRYGGTRLAINKVAFKGGSILFAVPGHNALDVANTSAGRMVETADSSTCPLGYYCEWSQTGYTGTRAEFYYCQIYSNPFAGYTGSWKNDQTPQGPSGPRVEMLFSDHSVVYTTPPPWSGNKAWIFADDFYIKPC